MISETCAIFKFVRPPQIFFSPHSISSPSKIAGYAITSAAVRTCSSHTFSGHASVCAAPELKSTSHMLPRVEE